MKFFIIALFAIPTLTFAATSTVTYDETYDQSSTSLNVVACSNGANGLITRGFTTFGSLPSFSRIGGAKAIAGWNSPNCGTCWNLTYTAAGGAKKSIQVLGIDHAADGFNIAKAAMNLLTNGHAVEFGVVTVQSQQVAASVCGL